MLGEMVEICGSNGRILTVEVGFYFTDYEETDWWLEKVVLVHGSREKDVTDIVRRNNYYLRQIYEGMDYRLKANREERYADACFTAMENRQLAFEAMMRNCR
jgi:hypothetical protein